MKRNKFPLDAMAAQKSIPVHFIPAHIAVNEAQLFEMLGLNDGRSQRGKRLAAWQFRRINKIPTWPGGVFPLRMIERAAAV